MITELTNHLWQSTVFAVLAGLLTLAFRKNRAQVRYWLWFSASFKFLVPFWVLMNAGSRLGWTPAAKSVATPAVSFAVEQIALPFSHTLPVLPSTGGATTAWIPLVAAGLWACGFGVILLIRLQGLLKVRAAVRSSLPLELSVPVQARSSPGLLEPGVVGFFRPTLLLPMGILERLTALQLEAILAHECCHVQRRDNLTSAIHMVVEAVFWFHPLVWWIGARLVEERERACDEMVLGLGNRPRDYAEGILHVCKNYVESPLSCVSGVTGSNLKRRIQAILTGRVARELSLAKKLTLAAAGVAALGAPVVIGAMSAPRLRVQSSSAVIPKFVMASIKPCAAFHNGQVPEFPGRLQAGCTTLQRYMQKAYGAFGNGHANPLSSITITGGPAWTDSDLYEIDAKAGGPEGQLMMKGPMLQALLEDRFQLKVHRETREIPVYELSVAQGGVHLQPYQGNCVPWDYDHPNPAGSRQCAAARPNSEGVAMEGWDMADLCYFLTVMLERPVMDHTGNTGRFDIQLELPAEARESLRRVPRGAPVRTDLRTSTMDPVLVSGITASMKRLGLNLDAATGAGEFVVIDGAQRPSEN
jgi:bla regulator protein BlaR1